MDNAAAGEPGAVDVELKSVTKNYGSFRAVDDFSLTVRRGSFTTLLGPSGCGKTTLLRIIAGFFEPDSGEVIISGKNQRGIPPEKRSTSIVFQDYALFPHMTVEENLAYGLRIRRLEPDRRRHEAAATAGALGLDGLLGRYPGELSGGQQQRLALGRALILKPQILLMDEPLSNLDAKLRERVRGEIKDIQQRLGITTIYVTHDQEEALSLSDYIAVMNGGRLEQTGTPYEIYNCPKSAFAADFTGPANFIELEGKKYMIRPEWISLGDKLATDTRFKFPGVVLGLDYFGRVTRVRVRPETPAGESFSSLVADIPAFQTGEGDGIKNGSPVRISINRVWELA
jgi:ABC-type Fe3+/spermidine/putrescine transport system ATPase subunit